jgi:hypothetical protein
MGFVAIGYHPGGRQAVKGANEVVLAMSYAASLALECRN